MDSRPLTIMEGEHQTFLESAGESAVAVMRLKPSIQVPDHC